MSGTSRPTSTFPTTEGGGGEAGEEMEDTSNVSFKKSHDEPSCHVPHHSHCHPLYAMNPITSLTTSPPPQGMLDLLHTGELADVDVLVGGRTFRCHKAILGAK